MASQIRILGPDDAAVLARVAPDVFDSPVEARWSAEFLADPRHHLAVALADDIVVGFASGVHYVHPDKAPEFFINEVGVAPPYRTQGLGKGLLEVLFVRARDQGCGEAWVLTEIDNTAARRLYRSAGGRESAEPVVMVSFRLR